MPLHDSFRNKVGKPSPVKLSAPPSVDDLVFSLNNARGTPRRPVMLSWQSGSQTRMLWITCGLDPSSENAQFILRAGDSPTAEILWRHDTTDPMLIHTVLADELTKSAPAAVIPEFLRPTDPAAEIAAISDAVEEEFGTTDRSLTRADFDNEAIGSVFAGKYEIIEEVGSGAMGSVYKALQRVIDRYVAIKVLHPELLAKSTNTKRFEHEARAASKLHHPNLIIIHDFGTSPLGRPFIVMDYVEGPSLHDVLTQRGVLSLSLFVEIFSQCCRALSHAHKNGIVHRDLKPSNIRLTQGDDGNILVKILDFGIAKARDSTSGTEEQGLTRTGDVLGSPLYMSPEQCKGETLDGRSDIYSLGCVMYQSITGVLPFVGADSFATMYKHIYEKAAALHVARPDLEFDPEVERIIFKALTIDLSQRYDCAESLEIDLQDLSRSALSKRQAQTASRQDSEAAVGGLAESTRDGGAVKETRSSAQASVAGSTPAHASVAGSSPAHASPTGSSPAQANIAVPVFGAGGSAPNVVHSGPALSFTTSESNLPTIPPDRKLNSATSGENKERKESAIRPVDLLLRAQILAERDYNQGVKLVSEVGGEIGAILLAQGKIDKLMWEAACQCRSLLEAKKIDDARAMIALCYCHRMRCPIDQAIEDLGF